MIASAALAMPCLDEDAVFGFVEGRLGPDQARAVEAHIATCVDCRVVVAEAIKFCARGEDEAPRVAAAASDLPPGTTVARYVVEGPIGFGSGGVVYAAYDPQLDRRVALKLVRPAPDGDPAASQARLLGEAQAMARLAHPNVVGVFDAGVYGGLVFVVMELVEGQTLAAWLRRAPRGWRAVAAVFADAGRGLAAAHAAGIVHRDFKPENVLLGADGRPRVTDFGLARRVALARAAGVPPGAPSASPAGAVTTATAGTPAYMAPEQFGDGAADARTDQFNFCAALHLALFGRHPSSEGAGGTGVLALVGHLVQDHFPAVVDAADVPSWLRALLRRGLSLRPEDRHPGMEPIIAALAGGARAAPPRTRRIAAGAAAAAALVIATVGILRARTGTAAVCGNGRVEPGEQCDDGNAANDDGCVACRWARCGDGFVRKGVEECDGGPPCGASCLFCRGDAAFVWPENGACYTRHDRPASWADARRGCAGEGADLIMYGNYYEAGAARTALLLDVPDGSWLGVTMDARGQTLGLDGRRLVASRWAADTALEPVAGQCVAQTPRPLRGTPADDPGLSWRSVPCQQPLPYVCKKATWTLRAATNHAYRLDLHAVSWSAARSACASAGAHLVTIGDGEEQSFVAALAAEDMWIGATDERQEGRFEWVTGEPFAFAIFAPGEPDDKRHTDNCVTLAGDELWHDRNCDLTRGFVCERD